MAMSAADDQGSSSSLAAAGIADTNSFFTSEQRSRLHSMSTTGSYQSEFEHFIHSQIANLIGQERQRNAALSREQELGIAIQFCKRFLVDGEERQQQQQRSPRKQPKSREEDAANEDGGRTPNGEEEELEVSISSIMDDQQQAQQRRTEVLTKLVELKLELEEYKDSLELNTHTLMDKVQGHEFQIQSATGRNAYCEACIGIIWRLVQRWRRCKVCGYRVHEKCLHSVGRPCPSLAITRVDFTLLYKICPEQTLRDQDFQCAECSAEISYDDDSDKVPRLCDYTGALYCRRCHWNDEMVIPARLVRNWDPEKRPVCRATKQLLNAVAKRPLIDLYAENAQLFKFVHTLNKVHKLRGTIMLMKCYFVSCKNARKLRILQHLQRHQHFVESESLYSLDDLIQLANGRLLAEIESIVQKFHRHITQECEICRGNAFFCELCSANERIYPFTENVAICKGCMAVYHRPCYDQASKRCPRCTRRRARRKAMEEVRLQENDEELEKPEEEEQKEEEMKVDEPKPTSLAEEMAIYDLEGNLER